MNKDNKEQINPINCSELPSRKMDMLIHLKVFKRSFVRKCYGTIDIDGYCDHCQRLIPSDCSDHVTIVDVPRYSSDIRSAWEIVDYFDDVQMHHVKGGTKGYGGTNMATINKQYRGIATTMAKALSIAALKACGMDVEIE